MINEYKNIRKRLADTVTLDIGGKRLTILREDAGTVLAAAEKARRLTEGALRMNERLNRKLFGGRKK